VSVENWVENELRRELTAKAFNNKPTNETKTNHTGHNLDLLKK